MTEVAVVTSCSLKGWEEYGERFVTSFDQYWPPEVKLHVVSEDHLTDIPATDRGLHVWHLMDCKFAENFLIRYEDDERAHGRQFKLYNFRFDAYKFSKKVFAIYQVASQLPVPSKLFWVDADVVTFAPVPRELFSEVLPDGVSLSCLDRKSYHSECGFIGYNLPEALDFIHALADCYQNGSVFGLNEWHDSWVFDWMRRHRKEPTFRIPHMSASHPFINSALGQYMDHLKGSRKKRGRSLPIEQVKNKQVSYWRNK